MKHRIVVLHGDNEHSCIKNADGSCSSVCPTRVTPDGYLVHEAVVLGLPTDELRCAIDLEGRGK